MTTVGPPIEPHAPDTRIPIGQLLVMREEYLRDAFDADAPCATSGRAQRLLKVIDELITLREIEGRRQLSNEC